MSSFCKEFNPLLKRKFATSVVKDEPYALNDLIVVLFNQSLSPIVTLVIKFGVSDPTQIFEKILS